LSVDIETKAGFITCIGFATSEARAMVVPFYSSCPTNFGNVWSEAAQEERVWLQVWRLLGSSIPKVFQNGMYDLQYLMRMGLRVRACDEDTMLMHHAIYPEMDKGLGFLGSVYTNEPAWKLMRKHKGDEVGVKADE
jgi:DNA polymerase I-like protein with 3'-5' exonuclease and polymerase domains